MFYSYSVTRFSLSVGEKTRGPTLILMGQFSCLLSVIELRAFSLGKMKGRDVLIIIIISFVFLFCSFIFSLIRVFFSHSLVFAFFVHVYSVSFFSFRSDICNFCYLCS